MPACVSSDHPKGCGRPELGRHARPTGRASRCCRSGGLLLWTAHQVKRGVHVGKGQTMRKIGRQLTLAVTCAAVLSGCAVVGQAPVTAPITINEQGPVSAGPAAGSSKIGRATATGI